MRILIDTSVWIDHFRKTEPSLVNLLRLNHVLGHPLVRNELALGNLPQRQNILSLLDNLPQVPVISTNEINLFIETHALYGLGIGLIDVHLLASVRSADNTQLWTRDKRLLTVAIRFNLAFHESPSG